VNGRLGDAELVERLNGMDLVSKPGEHFSYSNCAYDLVGVVIATVSGMSFEAFVDEKIFRPLGMTNSYRAGTRNDPDFAEGYALKDKHWVPAPATEEDKLFASGNLVSNVEDMQRWNRALLNASLLSSASLKEMFSVPILSSGADDIYASGWFIEPNGAIWHGGTLLGYGNANVLVPSTGHAITVLGNTQPGGPWRPWEVAREIYNATGLGPRLSEFMPIRRTTLPGK